MSEPGDSHHEPQALSVITASTSAPIKSSLAVNSPKKGPNVFVRLFRAVFGYRKTSLSFFVFLTFIAVWLATYYENSLELSVLLPSEPEEVELLDNSWAALQDIGKFKHPYGSEGNKYVHKYLEKEIKTSIKSGKLGYIEYDNDMGNNNSILFKNYLNSVAYYESNNLLVRINGTRDDLPALLISAHYDSVPSSYGITDDGAGIASMVGILKYYTSGKLKQPTRTIIFNFNNNEEFGLYGAAAFLNHPWSESVKYFINLEGTGQGGKAILFRGTDYGITKQYNSVRYPYATSIFQQAFNGRLIHSETDYKIYYENGGLRGIDIAFYKPRDIYHTQFDDIRHTSKKAVWHMLSSALDFVDYVSSNQLDIDSPYLEGDKPKTDYASFGSAFNFFFIIPIQKLILVNISLLAIVPVVSMILLLIIFGYKQNWRIGFVNSIKFPLSLVLSVIATDFITKILSTLFEFLPNSDSMNMVITLGCTFLFTNYLILNGINFLFKNYKVIQHDEKLIVMMQISFIYWVLLIISTVRLAHNAAGNDHTGEDTLTLLFAIQSVGSIFGLLGWCFKAGKKDLEYELLESGAVQPLIVSSGNEYGATGDAPHINSDASSLISMDSYTARKKLSLIQKTFSYDWFIQFIIVVPIPLLIIYNEGWLVMSGMSKSIQESLKSEELIFKFIEAISIACVLPLLPFVFKLNRFIMYILIIGTLINCGSFFIISPFNAENPMKLRFIESVNLTSSAVDSFVHVKGREGINFEDILSDMPSVKKSGSKVHCTDPVDGMIDCSYKSTLSPQILPKAKNFTDYLSVDILKNSSSTDYPYGLLTGEIRINVKDSNMCSIKFNTGKTKDFPVKTVIVYKDGAVNETVGVASTPEGFSTDKSGNFMFKDLKGIESFNLNKLDSDAPFHVGFQWLPKLIDEYDPEAESSNLKVDIECLWGNLGDDNALVPAYSELTHYSPLYVSWANLAGGMVSVSSSIEI